MSYVNRRLSVVLASVAMCLLLAACGSAATEQAQVSVAPTSIPTTAPLELPTATAVPAPTSTAPPAATPTTVPAPTVAPTPTPEATPSATAAAEASQSVTESPTATVEAEVVEAPTPAPTPTVEEVEPTEDAEDAEDAEPAAPTPVAETPTAVAVASGEPPLECYDRVVKVYRGFVDGVDELSFEGGRVYCAGAGTNAVSAAGSYRHSSGLIIQRNADYIFEASGTGYIPYSGAVHFCVDGQAASAAIRADTVPSLLVVIDNEAQSQLAQGASAPVAFTSSGTQC